MPNRATAWGEIMFIMHYDNSFRRLSIFRIEGAVLRSGINAHIHA